jgi:hypothetical protein
MTVAEGQERLAAYAAAGQSHTYLTTSLFYPKLLLLLLFYGWLFSSIR